MVSRPEPAPSESNHGETRRPPTARRVRSNVVGCEATSLYSCVTIQLIDRSAAACCPGQHLELRDRAISRFENLMAQVVRFWTKNLTTQAIGFSNPTKNPVGFGIFGLRRQMLSYLGSKHTILKLEIEPHRKQPKYFTLLSSVLPRRKTGGINRQRCRQKRFHS